MKTLSYPYKPAKTAILFQLTSVFAGGALLMGYIATTNDSGLVINGARFSPHGATIFYWCVSAISAAFAAMFISQCIFAFLSPRRLTLTSTEISLTNHNFWHRVTVIPFAEIKRIEIKRIQNVPFLNIYHGKGKLTISQPYLPDPAAFEELCSVIADTQLPEKKA